MKHLPILLALVCSLAWGQAFVGTANFSADLKGSLDTRPSTWGTAEAVAWYITFNPPPESMVEILGVEGDLVAWPTEMGIQPATVEDGRFAGVLLSLGNTSSGSGATRADWMDDNTFLYIQDVISQAGSRARFHQTYPACSVLLNGDNKVLVKVAAWLNDTGRKVHIEPTFTLQYRFRSSDSCQTRSSRSTAVNRTDLKLGQSH